MVKTNNVAGVCEEQLAVDSRNSSEKKKNHPLMSLCKLSFVLWPVAFVLFYIFEKVTVMFYTRILYGFLHIQPVSKLEVRS